MTCTVQSVTTPLYQAVLGSAWEDLSPAVRFAHDFTTRSESVGTFDITHGVGPARLIARCAGLPGAGKSVPTRLRILGHGGHEDWDRTFGHHQLRSKQYSRGKHLLAECFGTFEIFFQLEIKSAGIRYRQCGSAIRVGSLSLSVPTWLAPRVEAEEMPGSSPPCTRVCVTIHLPVIGLLARYAGEMELREGSI